MCMSAQILPTLMLFRAAMARGPLAVDAGTTRPGHFRRVYIRTYQLAESSLHKKQKKKTATKFASGRHIQITRPRLASHIFPPQDSFKAQT